MKGFFVFLLILVMITSLTSAHALIESSTIYGTLNIDQDSVSISEFDPTIINISGTIEDPQGGVRLNLELEKPDGSINEMETIPNKDGVFSSALFLDANWEKGDYTLQAIYQGKVVGTVNFVVTDTFTPEMPADTTVGTLEIEEDQLMMSNDKTVIAKLTGTIKNYERDAPIIFTIQKPDTTIEEISVIGKKTGEFTARITIRDGWPLGEYLVNVSYKDKALGEVSFVLNEIEIPDWVRSNALWWAQGLIEDQDFVSGIQYLIEQKIMKVPSTELSNEPALPFLPNWIKDTAQWWADGKVSDDDFVNGIQYLISHGIIRV